MKALSIKQPWAELISQGIKTIEIRSWNTKYRGYFLIHASKKPDMNVKDLFNFDLKKLLSGYILGYVKLLDVVTYNSEDEFLRDKDKHLSINGNVKYPVYGFILNDANLIKPIKYKGRLGFFEVQEVDFNGIQ